MPGRAKYLIGIGATVLILLTVVVIFLYNLVIKSFPESRGTLKLKGLHSEVDIYRDDYGVPHIFAGDEHDLMYAAGFVHAQDRLWQMDLFRRTAEGRLSEILDTATLQYDKLFRTLGLRQLADSLYHYSHPTSRRLLEDYAEGVNEFISSHKGKFPVEFDILNYDPEPWKPQHSLLISRLIAWQLNFAWWNDLTYARIADSVPPDKVKELFQLSTESPRTPGVGYSGDARQGVRHFMKTMKSFRDHFNYGGFSAGSNAWVIDSSKSFSGKPVIASDPHTVMMLPCNWYEAHLSAPGWNVSGASIPGIPLVVIGNNDSLAWGFTNAMIDDADFFEERTDSLNPDLYRYKNGLLPYLKREETIYVGRNDSITIEVRSTRHGPVIDNVHPSGDGRQESARSRTPISMSWTGFEISDDMLGFYRLNRARNMTEFEEGLKELNSPAQCAIYADALSNIGWWMSGKIPMRARNNGMTVLNGWTGEDEWLGYVPFDRLPRIKNPQEGFIASANQKIEDKNLPGYVSSLWEPMSRYNRIKELLSIEKLSVKDFQQFQQDVASYYIREMAGVILEAYGDSTGTDEDTGAALIYIRNWNYRCAPTDIASTILNTFFVRLLHNIYEDEMGPDTFSDFIYSPAPVSQATARLLMTEGSPWFDDIKTDSVETREMIVKKSFREAVGELKHKLGDEMKTWQWGKIHQVLFEHPLGNQKPLGMVLNVGPFPVGGGEHTINKGAYLLTDPFRLFAGPSLRQIVDLSKPQHAYRVLTLGQSGQPFHAHYDDQVSLWLNGGYRTTSIDREEIVHAQYDRLVLRPE